MQWLWRGCVLGLAAGHTAVAVQQQSMNADGLNYLTLGGAFWAGDWSALVNGIWSPLYGIVAAGVLAWADPPLDRVFPTVQLVNLLIFGVSLLCFERLWSELWTSRGGAGDRSSSAPSPLDPRLWWSIGYALFLWAGLVMVEIWSVTPDMMVACAVYLAAALMVRIGDGRGSWRTQALLGAVLGIGYLAKAPLFPLGCVALALTALTYRRVGAGLRGTAPAVIAFGLISGPLVAAISIEEGRPAFSEVSRFTYLKHVNRIPFPHWRADAVAGIGEPTHPPRQVHAGPDVFVYDGPVGGPYPPSLDPDYWTEGLSPRLSLVDQLNEIGNGLGFYFDLFLRRQGPIVGVTLLLVLLGLATGARPAPRDGALPLVVWSVACFAMYSLVFVTDRYIAPFVVLFWAGLFSYALRGSRGTPAAALTVAGWSIVAFTVVNVLALNVEGVTAMVGMRAPVEVEARGQFSGSGGAPGSPPSVARGLLDADVTRGEDVAYIGYSYTAFWAYLIDARIVAEIWPEQAGQYWTASEAVREEVLTRFRRAGASWAVAGSVPAGGPPAGWQRVGSTGYWVMRLSGEELP